MTGRGCTDRVGYERVRQCATEGDFRTESRAVGWDQHRRRQVDDVRNRGGNHRLQGLPTQVKAADDGVYLGDSRQFLGVAGRVDHPGMTLHRSATTIGLAELEGLYAEVWSVASKGWMNLDEGHPPGGFTASHWQGRSGYRKRVVPPAGTGVLLRSAACTCIGEGLV